VEHSLTLFNAFAEQAGKPIFMSAGPNTRQRLVAETATTSDGSPQPVGFGRVDATMGDSASEAALSRLNQAIAELKALSVAPLLQDAVAAIRIGDSARASELAIQALQADERNGHGWHVLAIAREQCGDFKSSIAAYESALALLTDHADVANDLGRLAYRMGMTALAVQLFRAYLEKRPDCPEGANNLACALRDQHDYQGAIDLLTRVIQTNPAVAMLWNTLATVLIARGDTALATPFLDEALRLEPDFAKARYTRSSARLEFGDIDGALVDSDMAIKHALLESDRAMMRFARSQILLVGGRVTEGWEAYEARFDDQFANALHMVIDRPRWSPESELEGRSMLLVGEQGLGDEVMFANYLPNLLQALGPKGRLSVALEGRLIPLFQRSFPDVAFSEHASFKLDGHHLRTTPGVDLDSIDLWAPLASPLRRFRASVAAFPDHGAYMTADPARIAYWRSVVAELPGRKVGILWKSLKLDGSRLREFSPFERWRNVLATPGISFVNLQYGDSDAEIEQAREAFGVNIWRPPGIDLKMDLDDLAALCVALDLVLGPANATSNIAGACGAPVWLISTPVAWPKLGTDRYPWYPATRVFSTEAFGHWDGVMEQIAAALGQLAAA
jgi:tetratricopeptide (TPR) repeat protein